MTLQFDQQMMLDWLTQHFGILGNGEKIEIRAFGKHGRQREFLNSPQEAAGWIQANVNPQQDVYAGVNPRLGRDGSKQGVSRLLYAWADLDSKHFASEGEAMAMVDGFGISPSTVNKTGGGYHLYWKIASPLDAQEQTARFEDMQKRLYIRLGGLDGVQDISRIMRIPGTYNNKAAYGQPQLVRQIMHNHGATTTLEEMEACLQITSGTTSIIDLRSRTTSSNGTSCHKESSGACTNATGNPPPLSEVAKMLSFVEPLGSYQEYLPIWMGVASAYPGDDGLALVAQWSSTPRRDNGQSVSPQTEPDKHQGFKRSGVTIGTVIHHAKQGGYQMAPPPQPKIVRRKYEPEYRVKLQDLTDPAVDDLPELYRRIYAYLGDIPTPFSRDFTTGMVAANFSALISRIRFANLNPALWFLGVAEQSTGKNRLSDALYRIFKEANPEMGLLTDGTPEGMWRELDGEDKQLYCYHAEYSSFLLNMRKEHMGGSKQNLCNLYDGRDIAYNLSKKKIEALRPYVTVVATTTHGGIKEAMTPEDLRSGYISRFLTPFTDALNVSQEHHPSEASTREMVDILQARMRDLEGVRFALWDTPNNQKPQCLEDYMTELGMNTGEVRRFEDALSRVEVPQGRLLARVIKLAMGLEAAESVPQVRGNTIFVREKNVVLAILLVRRWGLGATALYPLVTTGKDEALARTTCDALVKKPHSSMSEVIRYTHADIRDQRRVMEFLVAEEMVKEDFGTGRVARYEYLGRL